MTSKDEAARFLAVRARDRVVEYLTHGAVRPARAKRLDVRALLRADVFEVEIVCYARDRYGRQLGKVFPVHADGTCVAPKIGVSLMLLDEHLAVPYDGKGARLDEAAMIAALLVEPPARGPFAPDPLIAGVVDQSAFVG